MPTPYSKLLKLELHAKLQHHRDNDARLQRLPEQDEHRRDGEQVRHDGQSLFSICLLSRYYKLSPNPEQS